MEAIKSAVLDVMRSNGCVTVIAKQNDCNARYLKVTIACDGKALVVSKDAAVTINATREDGAKAAFVCEVNSNGTVSAPITAWMLKDEGIVVCDISVYEQNSRLTTTSFQISVEKQVYDPGGEAIDPEDDENYSILVSLLSQVSETENKISEAERLRAEAEEARAAAEAKRQENAKTSLEKCEQAASDAEKAYNDCVGAISRSSEAASDAWTATYEAEEATYDCRDAAKAAAEAAKEALDAANSIGSVTDSMSFEPIEKTYTTENAASGWLTGWGAVENSSEQSVTEFIPLPGANDYTLKLVYSKAGSHSYAFFESKDDSGFIDGSFEFYSPGGAGEKVIENIPEGAKYIRASFPTSSKGEFKVEISYETELSKRLKDVEENAARFASEAVEAGLSIDPVEKTYSTDGYTPGWLDNGWINSGDTEHGITDYIDVWSSGIPGVSLHCVSSGWYTYGFFSDKSQSSQIGFNSFSVSEECDYVIDDVPEGVKYVRASFPLADKDSFYVTVKIYSELAARLAGFGGSSDGETTTGGLVTTDKIADDSISTAKLQGGAVTGEKLSLNAVSQWNLADGAVVTSKIGDGQVTAQKLSGYTYASNQPTTYTDQLPAVLSDAFGGPLKEFVVYGTPSGVTSVTVDIGGNYYDLDLKGETLYGVENGTRDELHYTDGVGVIWKRVGGERKVDLDPVYLQNVWQNCIVNIIADDSTAQCGINYVRNANFLASGGNTSVTDDQLPMKRVRFKGDVSTMSKDNSVSLTVNAEDTDRSASVKWQGSSSLNYDKKNYTIKFDEAFNWIDGWGEQKKYVLKADWIDPSHLRNVVCAKLWGDVVSSRAQSEIKSRLSTAPNWGAIDGVPCSLTINGSWAGLYNLTVPKDAYMMGMGSGERECILSAESHGLAENFKASATVDGSDFDIEYVSDEANSDWVASSLNTAINACINATSIEDIEPYIDVDSAIDYLIFVALITGTDNTDKNYLLSTYDGTKWFFTAYDMDGVFGMDYMGSGFYSVSHEPTISSYTSQHRLMTCIKLYAKDKLKARYQELRSGALSEEHIYERFVVYQSGFSKYGMIKDCELWTGMPGGLSNSLDQIMTNARLRLKFLDSEIESM